MRIAVVHVIDAVTAAEVAANRYRIFAHLPGHAAVKCNSIGRTVHDADKVFPAVQRAHDLLRAPAHRRRRVVGMQRHANISLLSHRNPGSSGK